MTAIVKYVDAPEGVEKSVLKDSQGITLNFWRESNSKPYTERVRLTKQQAKDIAERLLSLAAAE